jgi:hypothetical protein
VVRRIESVTALGTVDGGHADQRSGRRGGLPEFLGLLFAPCALAAPTQPRPRRTT